MWRALTGLVLAVPAFLGGGELLFRALPVSTATMSGYHLDPKILTYPARHQWQVATGWDLRNAQVLRSNNLGFVSDHDFVAQSGAVALIGDSYVEASMLPAASRPAAQLEQLLGGRRPIYAMGGPGSSLLDYVERVRLAHRSLGIRDFVILAEAGDVRQSLCGSGNVHGPCLDRQTFEPRDELQPAPSALKLVLRHSAFAQYVYGQLKFDAGRLARRAFSRNVPEPAALTTASEGSPQPLVLPDLTAADAVNSAFLSRLAALGGDLRVVLLVDGRRDPKAAFDPAIALERQRLIDRARTAGLTVVDAEPLYAAHAAKSPLLLSVGPYDGHLNPLGVRIVMDAAARELR